MISWALMANYCTLGHPKTLAESALQNFSTSPAPSTSQHALPGTSAVTGQHSNQLNYVPAMQLRFTHNPRRYRRLQILHTVHVSRYGGLSARKPPARNRELVTGQIIAKERSTSSPELTPLPRWIPCLPHLAPSTAQGTSTAAVSRRRCARCRP